MTRSLLWPSFPGRQRIGVAAAAFAAASLVAATSLAASAAPTTAMAQIAVTACDAYGISHEATALPATFLDTGCNWTGEEIRNGLIGVIVPARGRSVAADALSVNGSIDLFVSHAADGLITLATFDNTVSGAVSVSPATAELPACSDSAGHDYPWYVVGSYHFRYNPYAQPAADPDTQTVLVAAHTNLASSYTDCAGLTRAYAPPAYYDGTTTKFANINLNYTCGTPDGSNVVSWLSKPGSGILAETCTWPPAGGPVTESDQIMDTSISFFTGNPPVGCSNSYDLQGTMTHETGHTYGLNHSDTGGTDHTVHGNLTMNSLLDPCTTKYRTLGAGDINAMFGHY